MKRFEPVLSKIQKETGISRSYICQKKNLRASAHLVTMDAPSHAPEKDRISLAKNPEGNRKVSGSYICQKVLSGRSRKGFRKQTGSLNTIKKQKKCENAASRKVSGRSRKGFRKQTRKHNFANKVM